MILLQYFSLNLLTAKLFEQLAKNVTFERIALELILLFLLIAGGWFWMDSIGKREVAINFGREITAKMQLQLLDETVACEKIRLSRDSRGQMQIQRTYSFETTASGRERLQCSLILRGNLLKSWDIPPYVQPD